MERKYVGAKVPVIYRLELVDSSRLAPLSLSTQQSRWTVMSPTRASWRRLFAQMLAHFPVNGLL